MKFCRYAVHVLLLLAITIGSVSAVTVVRVEYKGTAVLPCTGRCSGEASWTVFHERSDILAECYQTFCRSMKDGYQMIYNQYRQGDLSLTISKVDYSKRGFYTCECDGRDQCNVHLQVEPLRTSVQIQSGDSLVMELEISDPVEVIYYSTGSAGGSIDQICAVIGRSLQCKSEYKHRTSLLSSPAALELRDMKESDSGVYMTRDINNEEDIHICTVTVTDPDLFSAAGRYISEWRMILLVALLVIAVVVIIAVVCCNVQQRREIQRLRRTARKNVEDTRGTQVQMTELR